MSARLVEGLVLVAWAGLGACDAQRPGPPWAVRPFPSAAEVEPREAELGRLLFYDPVLSSDGETACATCHSELWGMSDGLARSIGLGGGLLTGPGRQGSNVLARNAPTLWNVGSREALFWDGRETSLEAQVLAPLHSAIELDLDPEDAVAELASIPEYVERFSAAFPERAPDAAPSVAELQRALAAFERTLVSDDSLYDGWVGGDPGALSPSMVEGMHLFAEAGCATCHVPPLFSSASYARRRDTSDRGRAAVTGLARDEGAMLVPTLRNARDTEPYFHDGAVESLEEAVRHELARSGEALGDDEVEALVAFIGRGLADRSREPDRPDEVPSGLPVPIDGFRIPRP